MTQHTVKGNTFTVSEDDRAGIIALIEFAKNAVALGIVAGREHLQTYFNASHEDAAHFFYEYGHKPSIHMAFLSSVIIDNAIADPDRLSEWIDDYFQTPAGKKLGEPGKAAIRELRERVFEGTAWARIRKAR